MNSDFQNSISVSELKSLGFFGFVLFLLNRHSGKVVNQHRQLLYLKWGDQNGAIKLPMTAYYKIQSELTFSTISKQNLCAFFSLIQPSRGFRCPLLRSDCPLQHFSISLPNSQTHLPSVSISLWIYLLSDQLPILRLYHGLLNQCITTPLPPCISFAFQQNLFIVW